MSAPRTEYLDGYNAGHADGEVLARSERDSWRSKYIRQHEEVCRLRAQVKELKASLLRLLSPELGLANAKADDALGEQEGCVEHAEQNNQADEAEDEVHAASPITELAGV